MHARANNVLIQIDNHGTYSFSLKRDVTDNSVSRLKTKVAANTPMQAWVPRSRMYRRNKRWPNCDAAIERVNTVIDKTSPNVVMMAPAVADNKARASAALP